MLRSIFAAKPAAAMAVRALMLCCALSTSSAGASTCTQVYFLSEAQSFHMRYGFIYEILIRPTVNDEPKVVGILLNGDWGVLNVCSETVFVRAIYIGSPARTRPPPARAAPTPELLLDLKGQDSVYVSIEPAWERVAADEGARLIQRIEERAMRDNYAPELARRRFSSNRYGLVCPRCDRLRPDNYDPEVVPGTPAR